MWKLLRPDATEFLEEPWTKRSLARYFAVMQNEKTTNFKIAQKIPSKFGLNDSLDMLWEEHQRLTDKF
jgi:uncharacterized Fe-S radical SAM superfamily protein PflX